MMTGLPPSRQRRQHLFSMPGRGKIDFMFWIPQHRSLIRRRLQGRHRHANARSSSKTSRRSSARDLSLFTPEAAEVGMRQHFDEECSFEGEKTASAKSFAASGSETPPQAFITPGRPASAGTPMPSFHAAAAVTGRR